MKLKTLKKYISIFTIVCMVLTQLTALAYYKPASENVDSEPINCEKEMITLKKLGVFSFDDISEIDVDKKVTRAEFADYFAKALNATQITDTIYFSDVKTGYWASWSINALTQLGALNGGDDGNFNPEDFITVDQAYKIVLCAAGYREAAEAKTYGASALSGYSYLANRLKINVDVKSADYLTVAESAQVIYNIMDTEDVIALGNKSEVNDKTMFESYRNVYIEDGVLNAYYGGSINSDFVTDKTKVYINSQKYNLDTDIVPEIYFGSDVEYTYIKDADGNKKIIYIENDEGVSDEITVTSEQIDKYDKNSYALTYFTDLENGKTKKINIERTAQIIYNGAPTEKRLSDITDDFINDNRYGQIRFIKRDGGYSLLVVTSYDDFMLNTYNEKSEIYYGKSESATQIDFTEYENVSVFDSSSNEIALPVNKDSVVAFAPSDKKEYIELVYFLNTISGKVEAIYKSDNKITIDGESYELSKQCSEIDNIMSLRGANVKATVNLEGKIAYLSIQNDSDYTIGYIIKSAVQNETFETNPAIRLYLPDTVEIKDFEFADRVTIDGESIKSTDINELFAAFPGDVTVKKENYKLTVNIPRQVIRFMLNDDGKLKKIDTYNVGENEDKNNSLTQTNDGSIQMRYLSQNSRIGMDCILDPNNTKVIYVPEVDENNTVTTGGKTFDEDIKLYSSIGKIVNDRDYYIESYKVNQTNYYQDIIVVKMPVAKYDQPMVMYKEVRSELDENGVQNKYIVGFEKGVEVKYILEGDYGAALNNIEQGDIVLLTVDISGRYLISLEKVFDKGTMTIANDGKYPYWYQSDVDKSGIRFRNYKYQISKTFAKSVNNGYLYSTYDFYDMSKNIIDECTNISALPVTMYDNTLRKDSIVKGTAADIKTYDTAGDACSVMIVFAEYGTLRQIFIYN